jgi:hypothetical protein
MAVFAKEIPRPSRVERESVLRNQRADNASDRTERLDEQVCAIAGHAATEDSVGSGTPPGRDMTSARILRKSADS